MFASGEEQPWNRDPRDPPVSKNTSRGAARDDRQPLLNKDAVDDSD